MELAAEMVIHRQMHLEVAEHGPVIAVRLEIRRSISGDFIMVEPEDPRRFRAEGAGQFTCLTSSVMKFH